MGRKTVRANSDGGGSLEIGNTRVAKCFSIYPDGSTRMILADSIEIVIQNIAGTVNF
ncbi:MAG: hypothetical protein LBS62_06790 [Clostridiales bacterium]|nr:hypothetical protein [Clostridiales bacterium]